MLSGMRGKILFGKRVDLDTVDFLPGGYNMLFGENGEKDMCFDFMYGPEMKAYGPNVVCFEMDTLDTETYPSATSISVEDVRSLHEIVGFAVRVDTGNASEPELFPLRLMSLVFKFDDGTEVDCSEMEAVKNFEFDSVKAFTDSCYRAYQLLWMIRHGYSLKDISESFSALADGSFRSVFKPYGEYDSLYSHKSKFLETEFLDEGYMLDLLALMPDAENNVRLWRAITGFKEQSPARTFAATVAVEKKMAARINRYVSHEPENEAECLSEDETICFTAAFENGYQADIKCCGVQYNEGECNTAWTEAVLFNERGCEVTCSEPSEEYFGRWELQCGSDKYVIDVIVEDPPEIDKMMTICTSHLTKETARRLDEDIYDNEDLSELVFYPKISLPVNVIKEASPLEIDNGSYGWWIHIPKVSDDFHELESLPEDLFRCVKYAHDLGCAWLCLDRDGATVDGLPEYDW